MVRACNSSTWEVEVGESWVPSHRQLRNEFQASLDYMRLCFKQRRTSDLYSILPYSEIYRVLLDLPFPELLFQPQHCQESNLCGREIIQTATYNVQCPAKLQKPAPKTVVHQPLPHIKSMEIKGAESERFPVHLNSVKCWGVQTVRKILWFICLLSGWPWTLGPPASTSWVLVL